MLSLASDSSIFRFFSLYFFASLEQIQYVQNEIKNCMNHNVH